MGDKYVDIKMRDAEPGEILLRITRLEERVNELENKLKEARTNDDASANEGSE